MNKERLITSIVYGLSAASYITYLCTQENIFMLLGGLLLIAASIMMIIINKKH